MASLKVGYWNIHGHTSKIVGNKLNDPEFIKVVSKNDIIGLGEIHSESEVSIPGFVSLKQKIRDKKTKGPKIAGGIGVFVKEEILNSVTVVENKNIDSIWVRIRNGKEKKNDLYLGTYYVSPDSQKSKKNDFFHSINEEIVHFSKKGDIIIQGDLNGRTGEDLDFIESDKFDADLGIDDLNKDNQILRNSEDKVKNQRGEQCLDLCKLNDLLILNGRLTGDIFGKLTCHNWNGSSVVDYCIVPYDFLCNISSFTVGEYLPWLSDHYISTLVHIENLARITKGNENNFDLHPGFLWNEEEFEKYKEALSLPQISEKVNNVLSNNSLSVTEISEEIKSILFENADISKLKVKKNKNDNISEAWFDKECKDSKNKIRSLGKKLSNSPEDTLIRKTLCEAKKSFRRKIAYKKRKYRQTVINDMESKRKDGNQRDFWKIFRKISPKTKREPVVPSVDSYFNYFKGLSVSSRPLDMPDESQVQGALDYEISLEELENVCKKTKKGKAVGLDYICNEMLIALMNTYPELLLKLFNAILLSGDVLVDWSTGLIVPIYKDGPKLVPSNYRGITLSSCLSKIFLAILNNRLIKFVKDKNLLTPSQLGFVLANRPSDAHIIIYNLIREVCHKEG